MDRSRCCYHLHGLDVLMGRVGHGGVCQFRAFEDWQESLVTGAVETTATKPAQPPKPAAPAAAAKPAEPVTVS